MITVSIKITQYCIPFLAQSVREEGGRLNSGVRHPRVGETDTGFQLGMVPGNNFFQLGNWMVPGDHLYSNWGWCLVIIFSNWEIGWCLVTIFIPTGDGAW